MSILSPQTADNLKHDTLERIQDLIQANLDSSNGFREAAEEVSDGALAKLFRDYAAQRQTFANELGDVVRFNGERPREQGSTLAALHLAWMEVRNMLTADDHCGVLCEAERGEDRIKQLYEEVLKDTAGSAVNDLLLDQYAQVKAAHDTIRDMRDQFQDEKN